MSAAEMTALVSDVLARLVVLREVLEEGDVFAAARIAADLEDDLAAVHDGA